MAEHSKLFDFIAHGGDKVAELEAALEQMSGYLGLEIKENARLRAENERLQATIDRMAGKGDAG